MSATVMVPLRNSMIPLRLSSPIVMAIDSRVVTVMAASSSWVKRAAIGRVIAHREWLEQVLLAVLDNAMKYCEPGTAVTLRASSYSLVVEDKGSGIDEK